MKITTEDLQKLLDDVTPGEWVAALEHGCHGVIAAILPDVANFVAVVGNDAGTPEREPMRFANAEIMAMAPAITREVIALRAMVAAAKAMIAAYDGWCECASGTREDIIACGTMLARSGRLRTAIAAYEAHQ